MGRQKIIAEEQAKRTMEAAQKKQAAAAKTPWNKVPVSGKKVQQSGGGQKKSLAEVMKEQQKAKEGKKKPQVAVSQKAQKAPTLKLPGGSQWNQRISQAQAAPTRPAPAPAPKVNKTKVLPLGQKWLRSSKAGPPQKVGTRNPLWVTLTR